MKGMAESSAVPCWQSCHYHDFTAMLLTVRASFQKCPPLASDPCEAVFLCGLFPFCTSLLPPPQRPAERHIRLSLSGLSSVLYFASALMAKSADRCCVLSGLPLNSCLFLCNYSHWWSPRPCGVTLCLLAETAHQASLFLGGTAHLSWDVVSFTFSWYCSSHLLSLISFISFIDFIWSMPLCCFPLRFKQTLLLWKLSVVE